MINTKIILNLLFKNIYYIEPMNELYTFPIALVFFFIPWLIIYIKRKDLRRRMRLSGAIMTPVTLMEYWCLKDYWNPPGPYFLSYISIENILFFFLVTGLGVTVFDFIFKRKNLKLENRKVKLIYMYVILILLSLVLFTSILKFNSIMVISIFTILYTLFLLTIRKDLAFVSLISGVIITLLFILIYSVLFNFLFPEYWDKYWLLNHTNLGLKLLGNIPATELLWAFSWGSFSGVAYDFAAGYKKASL